MELYVICPGYGFKGADGLFNQGRSVHQPAVQRVEGAFTLAHVQVDGPHQLVRNPDGRHHQRQDAGADDEGRENEGDIIRINVPPLTEERRIELVKKAKAITEDTKIGIRNARRHGNDEAKQLEKDGLPEDEAKKLMDEIKKLTDSFSENIDKLFEEKEKDILTV